MLNKTCIEFSEILSTKEPVPGGGGASAYVGALGCALGMMVGNLTVGKKKYADVEADIISLNEKTAVLMKRMEELVLKDAEAFYPLSQAYGMPKDTPEQMAEKERVLQACLVDAAKVPLEIAECAYEALLLVDEFAKKGSVIAISDAGVAAAFLKAALDGAKLNVMINTRLMKDESLRSEIDTKLADLVAKGDKLADDIYDGVAKRLTI